MLNAERLREVADFIRRYPDEYNQGVYGRKSASECGAAYCVAGTTVLLSEDWELIWTPANSLNTHYEANNARWVGEGLPPQDLTSYQRICTTHDAAVYELGLTVEEGYLLFSGGTEPLHGMTMPEALEKIAAGTPIDEVVCVDDEDGSWDD